MYKLARDLIQVLMEVLGSVLLYKNIKLTCVYVHVHVHVWQLQWRHVIVDSFVCLIREWFAANFKNLCFSFSWFYYIFFHNTGLFTADQKLQNNKFGISSAIYTRQNANGNRRGFECPEERDHYPYWHPNPWRDIAVLTDDISLCEWYQAESVKPRGICKEKYADSDVVRSWSTYNNQDDCEINAGT